MGADLPGEDAYIAMMSNPAFGAACKTAAELTLARNASDAILLRLAKDGSSMFFAIFALYLDARGGLTLSSIQQFCQDNGLQSPGRSAAILMQLRIMGFVERDTIQRDNRTRRYVPTARMKNAMVRFFKDALAAVSVVEPECAALVERLSEPDFFTAYVLHIGIALEHMLRRGNNPTFTLFVERNLGLSLLFAVTLTAEEGDEYPPRGTVRLSISELARGVSASRAHVTRLFRDAEELGLIRRDTKENTAVLTDKLRDELMRFHAGIFMGNASCAWRALQDVSSGTPIAEAAQ